MALADVGSIRITLVSGALANGEYAIQAGFDSSWGGELIFLFIAGDGGSDVGITKNRIPYDPYQTGVLSYYSPGTFGALGGATAPNTRTWGLNSTAQAQVAGRVFSSVRMATFGRIYVSAGAEILIEFLNQGGQVIGSHTIYDPSGIDTIWDNYLPAGIPLSMGPPPPPPDPPPAPEDPADPTPAAGNGMIIDKFTGAAAASIGGRVPDTIAPPGTVWEDSSNYAGAMSITGAGAAMSVKGTADSVHSTGTIPIPNSSWVKVTTVWYDPPTWNTINPGFSPGAVNLQNPGFPDQSAELIHQPLGGYTTSTFEFSGVFVGASVELMGAGGTVPGNSIAFQYVAIEYTPYDSTCKPFWTEFVHSFEVLGDCSPVPGGGGGLA